jgi:hypothetical protein
MNPIAYNVERWSGVSPPSEDDVLRMIADKGFSGYRWSNPMGMFMGRTVMHSIRSSLSFRVR